MAHVKVVRRSMSTDEWINLRFGWLKRHTIAKAIDVTGWEKREARQVAEATYTYYDPDFVPLHKGDIYFTPDGTCFMRAAAQIPAAWRDLRVWLELKTAAEMMVKVNGKWAGGIDPNRGRMRLDPYADADGKVYIEIEGYNRSKPDDDRNLETRAYKGCCQAFNGARLVVLNDDVQAAVYDVQLLIEAKDTQGIDEDIRVRILRELDAALNLVDYEEEDPDVYAEQVRQLREHLQTTVFSMKNHRFGKVALVSHSHLDIAYHWRRVHAIQKNARTCLIQLRLMEQYPNFCYCHTQPYLYETLEQYYPEIFEELREKVRSGQFELVGAMYVEPDCNVPTAESLVRQCLYGQRYYRRAFGRTVENCWLPDVFGNSWILPQILQKSGVRYFVSNKMSTWNDTNRFPHNHFIWRGIDGTEVFACVPPTHFITWNTPSQIIENWDQLQDKEVCNETLSMFGYGDGGSGATEEMLEYEKRLHDLPGMPEIRHVRGDEFLADNFGPDSRLPIWDGELYLEMHRGTFTTKAALKKWNRELELQLRDAEALCTMAALRGMTYPQEELTRLWKLLLVNQFHDILPGSHIAPVTRDAVADYEEIAASLRTITTQVAGFLVPEAGGGNTYTLFNTFGWERHGVQFIAGDFAGQTIQGAAAQAGKFKGQPGLWAQLDPLAPMSSSSMTLTQAASKADTSWFTFADSCLETPWYRLSFAEDGSLTSVYDKTCQREAVAKGGRLNALRLYRDNPGSYDAWDILPNYKDRPMEIVVAVPLHLQTAGDVFVQLAVELATKKSRWTQTIRLYRQDRRIDFDHKVDWHERHVLAKVEFDVNVLTRTACCDTSAGTIVRDTHANTSWQQARFETCAHKWVDVAEPGYGIAVLNDSKYGVSFDRSTVGLSLLRASARPDPYADEGEHVFSYALLPHDGPLETSEVIQTAWLYNSPMPVLRGIGDPVTGFLTLSHPNLHIQSVKMPEDGSDGRTMIVRIMEVMGMHGTAMLRAGEPIRRAEKTNLLEDAMPDDQYALRDGTLEFAYAPYEMHTFCIEL